MLSHISGWDKTCCATIEYKSTTKLALAAWKFWWGCPLSFFLVWFGDLFVMCMRFCLRSVESVMFFIKLVCIHTDFMKNGTQNGWLCTKYYPVSLAGPQTNRKEQQWTASPKFPSCKSQFCGRFVYDCYTRGFVTTTFVSLLVAFCVHFPVPSECSYFFVHQPAPFFRYVS